MPLRHNIWDCVVGLGAAGLVNLAMLCVAAALFHRPGLAGLLPGGAGGRRPVLTRRPATRRGSPLRTFPSRYAHPCAFCTTALAGTSWSYAQSVSIGIHKGDKRMRALHVPAAGEQPQVADLPVPEPAEGTVLIKVGSEDLVGAAGEPLRRSVGPRTSTG